MAIINQNDLFDRLQEYIDKKIGGVEQGLRDLFEEYGLKLIGPYLEEIRIVANNIEYVVAVAPAVDDIQVIVETPGLIDAILTAEDMAIAARLEAWNAEAEAMTADEYATNGVGIEVSEHQSNGDGTFTKIPTSQFSALHYSIQALSAAAGFKLQGFWDIRGVDSITEPQQPMPLDDPDNPGTPLPYEDGMYWYILGNSVFDPDGDGVIDSYPTYGPAASIYNDGDQILYVNDPVIPFQPWMKKRDAVDWDRIFDVPLNVRTALSYLGLQHRADVSDRMIGDLMIQKADPMFLMRNLDVVDSIYTTLINSDGDYGIVKMTDAGTLIDTKMRIDGDSLTFRLMLDKMTYNDDIVWTAGNDGHLSGLDADTVDGVHGTELMQSLTLTAPDLNTLIISAIYYVKGLTTDIFGKVEGTLISKVDVDSINHLFYNDNVIATRTSVDGGNLWSDWKQFGSMDFDGQRLVIDLPS